MSNEWYTPAKYIEAAREVMGGIDLDPASCEQANRTVQATRYYNQEDNGLMHPWYGRVWCNPPFGKVASNRSWQGEFVGKTLREYRQGNIEQAVLLVLANVTKKWFQPLYDFPLCMIQEGHIKFHRPDGTMDDFRFGACISYLGPHEGRFINAFSRFGRIVRAVDTPAPKPIARELWAEEVLA